jgi:hypothetical protein
VLDEFQNWRCPLTKEFVFKWGTLNFALWLDGIRFQIPLVPYTYYLGDQKCLKILFWVGLVAIDIDVYLSE